jgi:hypothetical protein
MVACINRVSTSVIPVGHEAGSRVRTPHLGCTSGLGQDRDALLHGPRGFEAQLRVIVVTDRVRNHREQEVGPARDLGHGLCARHEPIGDDRGGRYPPLLDQYGIVHTARRAAASITHGGDHSHTGRQRGDDLGGRRSREIRFLKPQDVGDAIL